MKKEIDHLIAMAEDSLDDASILLANHKLLGSVNRAYYAIFHAVEAFLFPYEIYTKTHIGAIRKFSELYIKTGLLDRKWKDIFQDAFDARQNADYDLGSAINAEKARIIYQQAEEFLKMAREYFDTIP